MGYDIQMGECWRTTEQAEWNQEHGIGIANSVHCDRLAVDLILWKNGVMLSTINDYSPAGKIWKSYSTPNNLLCWGGEFQKPDVYHFSVEFGGIR